jgi:hypothetical protein
LFFILLAGDLFPQSDPTRVVWPAGFFRDVPIAFALGVAFGVPCAVAAMFIMPVEERGGEGGRPMDGATCDDLGRELFSLGFLNIR